MSGINVNTLSFQYGEKDAHIFPQFSNLNQLLENKNKVARILWCDNIQS